MISGNSGCGKTTLLHLVGTLIRSQKGEIWIEQDNLSRMKQADLDEFRGNSIGIVFQKPHLISSLTVKENLVLAQRLGRKKTDIKGIEEIMDKLEILGLRDRKIHQISQGQSQRVSIARAVLNKPKLLLADEPTASLDDENCNKVIDLLVSQAALSGSTLIVATHDHRMQNVFKNKLEL